MATEQRKGTRIVRRTQATLRAQGWRVAPAGGDLARWTFLALHPDRGVRLILVRAEAPARGVLAELLAFPVPAGCSKEIWTPSAEPGRICILRLPAPCPLVFTGTGNCDGCGKALESHDILGGKCPTCRPAPSQIETTEVRHEYSAKVVP